MKVAQVIQEQNIREPDRADLQLYSLVYLRVSLKNDKAGRRTSACQTRTGWLCKLFRPKDF